MTQNVSKMIRSRPGNGSPLGNRKGIASAPASESAPRIPVHAISAVCCQGMRFLRRDFSVTIASLVVVVACASAIAGWVATGSEMISYAGLQIAFAFFYSVFQGYAPDTDLDNVRNRVFGILFGLIVTGIFFQYIWPDHTIYRL